MPFIEAGGSQRHRTSASGWATFNFTVSHADDIATQITDVEHFLTSHAKELSKLHSRDGVELAVLDFGWEISSDTVLPSIRFPASLLKQSGNLGLEIEVSVYSIDRQPDE